MRLMYKERWLYTFTLGFLVSACIFVAMDGKHYWHELRFLFAATQFSIDDLLAGLFNPQQLGGVFNPASASGFYLSKILHIMVLKFVYMMVPPPSGGFILTAKLSFLYLFLTIIVCYYLYADIFTSRLEARFSVLFIFILPITSYLGGKILSESFAMVLLAGSIWFLNAGFKKTDSCVINIVASGILLIFTAFARLDLAICFVAFSVSRIFTVENKKERQSMIRTTISTTILGGVGYYFALILVQGNPMHLVRYFQEFVNAGIKSNLMSLVGILTFGGTGYLAVIMGLFHPDRLQVRFLCMWLFLSICPIVLITSFYMIEPRYLVHGILPLIGLGGLGLNLIWDYISRYRLRKIFAASLLGVALSINSLFVKIMPYELDRSSILELVDNITSENDNAVILIPWAYSDFHFLKVIRPNITIYNVNTQYREGKKLELSKSWKKRINQWYGKSYIDSKAKLDFIIENHAVYYLGWLKYPPLSEIKKIAQIFGNKCISKKLDSITVKNHLHQSWIWNSRNYRLVPDRNNGQYFSYKVMPR